MAGFAGRGFTLTNARYCTKHAGKGETIEGKKVTPSSNNRRGQMTEKSLRASLQIKRSSGNANATIGVGTSQCTQSWTSLSSP